MNSLLMIAEKVNDRSGRYVLAVYQDAVVAVRGQIDLPLEPFAMGLALFRFSRRNARREELREEIRTLPHEQLRKRYMGTRIFSFEEMVTVELRRRGRKSVLRFSPRSGRRRRLTMRSDVEVNELSRQLQKVLGSRFIDSAGSAPTAS